MFKNRILKWKIILVSVLFFPLCVQAYVARPGDTYNKIAAKHKIEINELITANAKKNPNVVKVGEFVFIPEPVVKDGLFGATARPELFFSSSLTRGLSLGGSETTTYVADLPNEPSGYAIINPTSASTRELIKYTGVTTTGGKALTGVTRGLAFYGSADTAISDVGVAANKKRHSAGESITMGNGRYEQNFADQLNGLTTSSIATTDAAIFRLNGGTICFINSSVCIRNSGGIIQWTTDGFLTSYNFTSSSISTLTASTTAGIGVSNSQIYVNASTTHGIAFDNAGRLYINTPNSWFDSTGQIIATSTPTAAKIPLAPASNYFLDPWINTSSINYQAFTAGEIITSTANPVPVYFNSYDNKVYYTTVNPTTLQSPSSSLWAFIGFAKYNQSVAANGQVLVQTQGIVDNFSGLSAGSDYFISVTQTGKIITGLRSTTSTYKIGRALGTGYMMIEKGRKIISASFTISNTSDGNQNFVTTIPTGFKPSKITCTSYFNMLGNQIPVSQQTGYWANSTTLGWKVIASSTAIMSSAYITYGTNNAGNSFVANAITQATVTSTVVYSETSDAAGGSTTADNQCIIED